MLINERSVKNVIVPYERTNIDENIYRKAKYEST